MAQRSMNGRFSKMKRRLFSGLLSAILALSLLPGPALAADESPQTQDPVDTLADPVGGGDAL